MEVSQLDRFVRITKVYSKKVILLEMNCPWVANKEAINEHKTWHLRLKRKVSGLKDRPVLHHVVFGDRWMKRTNGFSLRLCFIYVT